VRDILFELAILTTFEAMATSVAIMRTDVTTRPRVHFCKEGLEIYHYYERETSLRNGSLFSAIRRQLTPAKKPIEPTANKRVPPAADTGIEQVLCKAIAASAAHEAQYRKVGHRASVDCEDTIEQQRWLYATSLARMVGAPCLAVRFGDADTDVYEVRVYSTLSIQGSLLYRLSIVGESTVLGSQKLLPTVHYIEKFLIPELFTGVTGSTA
jgi:hypothetical protein